MLTIRLRRIGKRQHATFRFLVMEKSRSPQGRAVEFLGSYNPHTNPSTINLKRDRVEHWLKVGAQPSATVHNLLVDAGLMPGLKLKVGKPKKKEASAESTAPAAEEKPAKASETKAETAPASHEQKAEASTATAAAKPVEATKVQQ
ncbi:MAG: 30S ribosomal protein S16 [Candidatus Kerfeldbacteria bacterium]|nr:30S ribosomal protein S16 [Candidatus Kerfeldbacteria bacterium]